MSSLGRGALGMVLRVAEVAILGTYFSCTTQYHVLTIRQQAEHRVSHSPAQIEAQHLTNGWNFKSRGSNEGTTAASSTADFLCKWKMMPSFLLQMGSVVSN